MTANVGAALRRQTAFLKPSVSGSPEGLPGNLKAAPTFPKSPKGFSETAHVLAMLPILKNKYST